MAIVTSTITGQWTAPAGAPLAGATAKIRANTADGLLRDVLTGQVVAYQSRVVADDDGNLTVSLPTSGIDPASPQWVIEFEPKLGISPVYFTLSSDTTWAQVISVAEVPREAGLVEELSSLITDVRAGTLVANRRALAPWYAALANRDNAPAKIMTITDSTFHFGASTWAQTTPERVRALLQAKYPTTGVATPGVGYVPAYKNLAPTLPGVQSGGTGFTTGAGLGMEHYNIHNPGTAQYRELTFDGDAVRVWYGKSNYLVHQAIVSIDGVDQAPNLSSTNGIAYPPQVDGDGYYADYSFAAGTHTIRVRAVTAFAFILDGIEVFNGDQSKGIHVYNAGRSGGKASQYAGAAGDRHWEHAAVIKPQLWVVALGINDELDADTTAFLANMDTILHSKIPAAMGATAYSVLLVNQYRPSRATDDERWAAMYAGLRERVEGNIAWLDLGGMWPLLAADGSTSYGLMAEGTNPLHPSTLGHELQAQVLADAIGF